MKLLKLIAFSFVITVFMLVSLPAFPFLFVFKSVTRKKLILLVSISAKLMLKVLNIKVTYKLPESMHKDANFLIVANHLSYLDVIILATKFPSCFVTSTEVKESPFLGQLTQLAGCLFVDRKNKKNLFQEIVELREALNDGMNVIVFPEATSTNGEVILRFRRPLFEASIATQKPILPVTINYQEISGKSIDRNNRDIVCWYGDMTFLNHFLKVLHQKEILVEIVVSEPFAPEFLTSIELAIKSHQQVNSNYIGFSHLAMEAL